MRNSIDILKDCAEMYSAGETYIITPEDSSILLQDGMSVEADTQVTDEIFDKLYFYLKDLYPDNDYFLEVGAPERGGKVPLEFKMGSMTELKEGDWNKWKLNEADYVLTEKLDGCSLGLTFENGKLKCAQSRGNGIEGADVTRHYNKFKKKGFIPEGKIRGEVIIPKKDIQKFIDELEQETGKRYKNARNAVAGQLNSKVGANSFYKYVKFIAYKLVDCPKKPKSFYDQLELIKDSGFEVVKVIGEFKGIELDDEKLTEFVKQTKDTSEFECDGIILTLNNPSGEYTGFETGTLNPKDSRKFKIGSSDNIAKTIVKDVIWQISKDYLLKPVVVMDPVELVGVTVTKASAHNYKLMTSMGLGIGSEIIIKRSGDVIPYVEKVLTQSNNIGLPEDLKNNSYELGADLVLKQNIDNSLNRYYDEAKLQQLQYFCNTIKVDKAKYGNIRKMILHTGVKLRDYSIADLILEPKESFIDSIGIVGEQIFKSLHEKLMSVEEPVFFDAVGAFGRLFGTLKLSKIYNAFGTLDVTREQLFGLEGFAEISVNQYMNHIQDYRYWMTLINNSNERLYELVKFAVPKEKVITSNKFNSFKVVFTGIRDKDMEDKIVSGGGEVLNGLSSKCNLLVTKSLDSTSSKIQKAKKLGIPVISYDEAKIKFS